MPFAKDCASPLHKAIAKSLDVDGAAHALGVPDISSAIETAQLVVMTTEREVRPGVMAYPASVTINVSRNAILSVLPARKPIAILGLEVVDVDTQRWPDAGYAMLTVTVHPEQINGVACPKTFVLANERLLVAREGHPACTAGAGAIVLNSTCRYTYISHAVSPLACAYLRHHVRCMKNPTGTVDPRDPFVRFVVAYADRTLDAALGLVSSADEAKMVPVAPEVFSGALATVVREKRLEYATTALITDASPTTERTALSFRLDFDDSFLATVNAVTSLSPVTMLTFRLVFICLSP